MGLGNYNKSARGKTVKKKESMQKEYQQCASELKILIEKVKIENEQRMKDREDRKEIIETKMKELELSIIQLKSIAEKQKDLKDQEKIRSMKEATADVIKTDEKKKINFEAK